MEINTKKMTRDLQEAEEIQGKVNADTERFIESLPEEAKQKVNKFRGLVSELADTGVPFYLFSASPQGDLTLKSRSFGVTQFNNLRAAFVENEGLDKVAGIFNELFLFEIIMTFGTCDPDESKHIFDRYIATAANAFNSAMDYFKEDSEVRSQFVEKMNQIWGFEKSNENS